MDIERLSKLEEKTSTSSNVDYMGALEKIIRIIDGIGKLSPKQQAPNGDIQFQQATTLPASPYKDSPVIKPPIIPPKPVETKPVIIEGKATEETKTTEDKFNEIYGYSLKALTTFKLMWGDIPISQVIINLEQDKEGIKKLIEPFLK